MRVPETATAAASGASRSIVMNLRAVNIVAGGSRPAAAVSARSPCAIGALRPPSARAGVTASAMNAPPAAAAPFNTFRRDGSANPRSAAWKPGLQAMHI